VQDSAENKQVVINTVWQTLIDLNIIIIIS